jgi:hypothetical protein
VSQKRLVCSGCDYEFSEEQTRSVAEDTLTSCPNCGKAGAASKRPTVTVVAAGSFNVVEPKPGEFVDVSKRSADTSGPRMLRAEFVFQLADLFVSADAWGSAAEFTREGRRVRLSVPAFGGDPATDVAPPTFGGKGVLDEATGVWGWSIVSVTVAVFGELDVDLVDLRLGAIDREAAARARAFLNEATAVAGGVIRDVIDWTRVLLDQRWLGLTGATPPLDESSPQVFDEASGKKIALGEVRSEGWLVDTKALLDLDFLQRVLPPRLADGRVPPPVAELLLADALFHVRGVTPGDYARAVLLAAVALEVMVKDTLRTKTHPGKRALVDLVIESPREVSVAAAQLFDSGCEAALGRSLRTTNRDLYKRIDTLFQRRNAFAHRGIFPTQEEARDGVAAARTAKFWLQSLPSESETATDTDTGASGSMLPS